ncbi:unnamed protein product, partial [Rotaria sp. Silwood1]
MTEVINNDSNTNHQRADEYHIMEQDNVSNVQIGQISKFLLECPEAALNVHKYLQRKYSNQQQQIIPPLNSTPKCSHPLDDSGGSVNNDSGHRKHPRRSINNNKQRYTDNVQQTISQQSQQLSSAMSSNEHQRQIRVW